MAFWSRDARLIWDLPPARPRAPDLAALEFSACPESRHIAGITLSNDGLSDVFNRRDPFGCDFVLGPPLTGRALEIAAARRMRKVAYPVVIEGRDFDVRGDGPSDAGQRPGAGHVPRRIALSAVTNPTVRRGRHVVSGPTTDVVLASRQRHVLRWARCSGVPA